jgi:ABC-type multidrug transport system ATPase subunit
VNARVASPFCVVTSCLFHQPFSVLDLRNVSLSVGRGSEIQPILADIRASYPRRHFGAIIGPSGCGKSSLLKTISGIAEGDEEGEILWSGRDLAKHDFAPSEIGYVPQFSIAHDELTARECVETAVRLRVKGATGAHLAGIVDNTLAEVGLYEFADRRVAVLSGGQKRRLALAMEIASAPALLLCDEVTSGLDAQAEDEIVHLLHDLAEHGRLILSVTHSLRHVDLYDSVLVLFRGIVAYHGSSEHLAHYFRVDHLEQLYARLEERAGEEWATSWKKHADSFTGEILPLIELERAADAALSGRREPFAPSGETAGSNGAIAPLEADQTAAEPDAERPAVPLGAPDAEIAALPGPFSQFATLLARRFRILSRNRGQLFLQLGLIFGFPILVAIFAWNGLPQIQNLTLGLDQDVARQLAETSNFLKQASKIGSLVSGIVMFQVILLTLMGANNSGREIAAERLIFEKEKLAGLRPASYIASKAAFLAVLVCAQSLWMGLFVHFVCGFPGDLGAQLLFLILVNAAMSAVCLGISSWMASAEQASLVSIYLVGFQLPLSGAVLALPELIGHAVRPFIAAYWSWSGVLQTLRGERYYDIVQMVVQTSLSPANLCLWVLVTHIVAGLFIAWAGCNLSRMR